MVANAAAKPDPDEAQNLDHAEIRVQRRDGSTAEGSVAISKTATEAVLVVLDDVFDMDVVDAHVEQLLGTLGLDLSLEAEARVREFVRQLQLTLRTQLARNLPATLLFNIVPMIRKGIE